MARVVVTIKGMHLDMLVPVSMPAQQAQRRHCRATFEIGERYSSLTKPLLKLTAVRLNKKTAPLL